MKMFGRVHCAYALLRYTYGLLFLAMGVDKFFNMITMWSKYLSIWLIEFSPIDPLTLMSAMGVVEIVFGLLLLSGCMTRLGAYLGGLWFVLQAANLFATGMYFDVAMNNVALAIGCWALAKLAGVHGECHTSGKDGVC